MYKENHSSYSQKKLTASLIVMRLYEGTEHALRKILEANQ